jgi:hypothetical protein
MVGGGLEAKASKLIALRIAQVDWLNLPSEFGQQSSNVRFSTGIAFRF